MQTTTVLNTGSFDQRTQQALVFSLFEGLKDGADFVVLADAEPKQLCLQLDQLTIPNLHWEYLEKSPGKWKLRIEKLTPSKAREKSKGGCCGSCGG